MSFGYRHIIKPDALRSNRNVINIHLSYLPWNKGAHPNFWANWEGTPSGVTIHVVDEGIDTGPIIYQKLVSFEDENETFKSSYDKLFSEAENLFLVNFPVLIDKSYTSKASRNRGTFHNSSDLPELSFGWNSEIKNEILRLENLQFNPNKKYLDLIHQIENARASNNINWMDLLRVVANESPADLKEITKRIHSQDIEILNLFKKLAE